MTLLIKDIRKEFSEEVFQRGKKYYDEGRVLSAVKFEGRLYAEVEGSSDAPYSVEINLYSLDSDCTCPYGKGCKHAVASLLFLANKSKNVVDANSKFSEMEKLPKEELVAILKRLFKSTPEIFAELDFAAHESVPSIKPFTGAFGRAVSADINFMAQQKEIAKLRRLMEHRVFILKEREKARLCMEFLHEIRAYFDAVDDSNGALGELIDACIGEVLYAIGKLDKKERANILKELKKLAKEDDYGYFDGVEDKLKEIR